MNDDKILNGVLDEFRSIAAIPRPSGHEKKISDYLKNEFSAIGCIVVQDESNNIIADLPASSGKENAPLTILQSHMDMVCVADTGVKYSPLDDPIKLIENEEYLCADGTSLGSDDGTGIAEILYVFKNVKNHGPLRAIITVDEEVGMTGARNLDAKYLLDAEYYLNCDNEEDDLLTVASAGNVGIEYHRHIKWHDAHERRHSESAVSYEVKVSGLLGGHSGERIGDGRGNAIRVLAQMILGLREANIDFDVSKIEGGTARNAIPATASMVIVTCAGKGAIIEVAETIKKRFLRAYGKAEKDISIDVGEADFPERVMDEEDAVSFAELVAILHTGIFAMFKEYPGLIETSANIGIARTEGDKLWLSYFARSGIEEKLESFRRQGKILGKRFGFDIVADEPSPVWEANSKSVLVRIVTDVYNEQHDNKMRVESIHAGLECSYMMKKNPNIDIVSIGVTTLDIHSPKERLVLATVASQVRLIMGTLERIAAMEKK